MDTLCRVFSPARTWYNKTLRKVAPIGLQAWLQSGLRYAFRKGTMLDFASKIYRLAHTYMNHTAIYKHSYTLKNLSGAVIAIAHKLANPGSREEENPALSGRKPILLTPITADERIFPPKTLAFGEYRLDSCTFCRREEERVRGCYSIL